MAIDRIVGGPKIPKISSSKSIPAYKLRYIKFTILDDKRVSISVPKLSKRLIVQKQDLINLANTVLRKLT